MIARKVKKYICTTLFLFILMVVIPLTVHAQENNTSKFQNLIWYDINSTNSFSAIANVEYGRPDRLSFTSSYLHLFEDFRFGNVTSFYYTASVSPGIGGIRVKSGIAYIYGDAFWFHADLVYLHSWWKCSVIEPNQNYFGLETRIAFMVSFGIGYYWRIGKDSNSPNNFLGYHIGYGW